MAVSGAPAQQYGNMPTTGAAGLARKKAPRTGAKAPPSAKHTRSSLPPLIRGKGAHKQSSGGRKNAGATGRVPRHGEGSAKKRGWGGWAAYNPVPPISLRAEQLFSPGWFAAEHEQTRRTMHGWLQTVR